MEKVIFMLLLHDLGEIYAGDTWVFDDKNKITSYDKELSSIEKTLGGLPKEESKIYLDLWKEFEKGSSVEARYARVIDAIVPLINHLTVTEKNYNPENISAEQVYEKKKFIEKESTILWECTKMLIDRSVEKGLYSK